MRSGVSVGRRPTNSQHANTGPRGPHGTLTRLAGSGQSIIVCARVEGRVAVEGQVEKITRQHE
jgi:hypothetical protein